MIQRRNFLVVALGAVLALVGLVAFDSPRAVAKDPQVEGTLTAVISATARVASIRTSSGAIVKVSIPADAKVERNGVRVPVTAFKVGDRVQAKSRIVGGPLYKFEGTGK